MKHPVEYFNGVCLCIYTLNFLLCAVTDAAQVAD